jgi:tetratricopeptide (TPR) repeat protein
MKHLFPLFILFVIVLPGFAQAKKDFLYKSWVKVAVIYRDGQELSDDLELKYSYTRYLFEKPNRLFVSTDTKGKGASFTFLLKDRVLEVKNSAGYLINSFLVERMNDKELILLQMGQEWFTDPDCLRFSFLPEADWQKSMPLRPEDILSISGPDTVFREGERIYAQFKGNTSFHEFLAKNIPEYNNLKSGRDSYFLASFIVRKSGQVDSLQILEGISPAFDRQFVKAFEKGMRNWAPASYGGRSVDVQMSEEFRFISSGSFMPSYDYSKKGKDAMRTGEYSRALYYFEKSLETMPDHVENLYQRAVCNLNLGNIESSCRDLQRVKSLGSPMADVLLEKNCRK